MRMDSESHEPTRLDPPDRREPMVQLPEGITGVWKWRLEDDSIVWSVRHFRNLGYEPFSVKPSQEAWASRVHPDDLPHADFALREAVASGGKYRAKYRVVRPDGDSVHWIEAYATPLFENGACVSVTGFTVDVTDRMLVWEALRASEERYREVVETQTECICRFTRDGTLTFVNPAYCRYFGRSREELTGKSLLDLIPEHERENVLGRIETLATTRQPLMAEHPVLAADGSTRWMQWVDYAIVSSDGSVVEFQGIGRDITDRKVVEESLRQSNERYQLVLQATKAVIYDWDMVTDTLWWSQNGLRLFGHVEDQRLDSAWWTALLHPDERVMITRRFRSVLAEGRSEWEAEYRLRRGDGSYAFVNDRGYVVRDADGNPSRMIGSLLDVSDKRRLDEANEQLIHASRLATLGELSASIAHEISQPLSAIASNISTAKILLRSGSVSLDSLREIVEDLHRDAARAEEVVRHMRSLFRKSELVVAPFDLNRAIADVVEMASAELTKRRAVVSASFASLPQVHGDEVHIQQVVLNLLLNAAEAMATAETPRRTIEIVTGRDDGGAIAVSVSDCGPGIQPEYLPRLFRSFFSTRKEGLGLGLSIARSIVEAHGGHIEASNRAEGGATISFTLPHEPRASVTLASGALAEA
jgi:PAS domain S-box-containing protein